MKSEFKIKTLFLFVSICVIFSFSQISIGQEKKPFPKPKVIPHSEWQSINPAGFPAEGKRKNIAPGESIEYKNLKVELVSMNPAPEGDKNAKDKVSLKLSIKDGKSEEKIVEEGAAFNWEGFHIAILAAHTGKSELGAGLTEFEITTIESIPIEIANSTMAGDVIFRARIPHKIKTITLHHAGDPKPMTPQDDPVKKLQGLQSWGMRDKNWWDVPYHFLISIDGTIYEGRDYRYVGETNTKYDTDGHFLISVMGNYDLQEPTPAQIKSITDLMAWAVQEFNLPLEEIKGHSDYIQTGCPGKNLKPYLKDGTFVKGVKERLGIK